MKMDKWHHLLVHPKTGEKLSKAEADTLFFGKDSFPVINGKPVFISFEKGKIFEEQRDGLDQIKTLLKNKFGRYYMFLIYIIAPVYVRLHWPTLQTWFTHQVKRICKDKSHVIQIGSGNDRLSDEVLNIDIFGYEEVDMVADCTQLPFADNSIDCVVSNAVLEHVTNPEAFVKEAYRVLKPGGTIITGVPFMQGFHASPNDYYRWTDKGLDYMHASHGFTKESIVAQSGPTSGFLWILQEWLSIALSFNINALYVFFWFFFTLVLMPLKFLDILFIHYKQASKINSFFIYTGKK
jgi:hypothetical protein